MSARFYECEKGSAPGYKAKALEISETFHQHASLCLDTVDLTNPVAGTVEFVSLFLHCCYFQNQETSPKVWLLTGDNVRLAMRMGYHRDPSKYSHFTPFECEMRRRVWQLVVQTDLLFSFQLGLPTIVRGDEYDTLTPGNYYEDQLYVEMKNLPDPQPLDAPTYISYWIANDMLLRPFRIIVEELNSVRPLPYTRILELSRLLSEGHAAIPPRLQYDNGNAFETPDKSTTLKRIQLHQFYLKILCVLHRRYLTAGLKNAEYLPSTEACVESALGLLHVQQDLHQKEQMFFKQTRWMAFSLTNHDFVLAATILCLYLNALDRRGTTVQLTSTPNRAIIEDALAGARNIWRDVRLQSQEAAKAWGIVETMVRLGNLIASSYPKISF